MLWSPLEILLVSNKDLHSTDEKHAFALELAFAVHNNISKCMPRHRRHGSLLVFLSDDARRTEVRLRLCVWVTTDDDRCLHQPHWALEELPR